MYQDFFDINATWRTWRQNMPRDLGLGYKVVATVISIKGECHIGHRVGEVAAI